MTSAVHLVFPCSPQKRISPRVSEIKDLSKAEIIRCDVEIKDPRNKIWKREEYKKYFLMIK